MPMQTTTGAMMMCTMGLAPATLSVLPVSMVSVPSTPAATIMDYAPMVNIPPFGACKSPAYPPTAAATAAALGVLTPTPCVPSPPAPWLVGKPTIMHSNKPALDDTGKVMCMWGGTISFNAPGQFQVQF